MTLQNGESVRRVGYASGVFDLFHIGHLNILRHARENCDYLIAGVATDEYTLQAKGQGAVVPFEERLEIVASLRYVDEAVADHTPNKREMWEKLRFDILFKGDDWRGTPKGRHLEQEFADIPVRIVYFPYTRQTSSTRLRRLIDDALATGHRPEAAALTE